MVKEMTDIAKLAAALSKAQGEMKTAVKDSTNPHFKSKYATLASIWDACREALSNNELSVTQYPDMTEGGQTVLRTILMHSSGESISGMMPFNAPEHVTAQQLGSLMTYFRRYSLAAIVGVAPDDDDDGNAAQTVGGQAPVKRTLSERAEGFKDKISLSADPVTLDQVISKGAILMNELSKQDKETHKRLVEFIEKRREELKNG